MKREELISAVAWLALFAVCMAGMIGFAADKTIVIAEVVQEQGTISAGSVSENGSADRSLLMSKTYGVEGSFCIPLPKGIRAEHVTMENRYMDRELWLYIREADELFYAENAISGDLAPILSGQREVQEDGMLLKFSMEHVYEYRSTLNGSSLTIEWYSPREGYEFLIVLDPADGETLLGDPDGGDVTLQVARQVQKQFSSEGVRLYCTRSDADAVTEESRVRLAEETGADLYVRLSVSREDDQEISGISGIYEEDFFIPDFGSPELADLLTRETTISAGNRALGLKTAAQDSILKQLRVPAAELSLGCLSHPKEAYLLSESAYQEKLAAGIVKALEEAVEELRRVRQ